MNAAIEAQIYQDARKLNDMDKFVVKNVINGDMNGLVEVLKEYISTKKRIKKIFLDYPVIKVHDFSVQKALKKLDRNEFEADKMIKRIEENFQDHVSISCLEDSEIEELGSDIFYSWYSHHEYVEALYDIGSLIVDITIPKTLVDYVSEARTCYAFQQYNAVYGLCRTILEIALRHECDRRGLIQNNKNNTINIDLYRPSSLISKVSKGELRDRLKQIYQDTSAILHGAKTIQAKDAKKMFRDTLEAVQDIYKG